MEFKFIDTNGITLRAAVEGEGPLIIMVHGCPESWFSWRRQIPVIAEAGYKVAAIDVRGYGGSDKPHAIEEYTLKKIGADIVGIIDFFEEDQAILIGHDWGGPIVWYTSLLNENRISAVAGLSVPYFPQREVSPLDAFEVIYKDKFFYQLYFQKEGVAESEFEPDLRKYLESTYFSIDARGMKKQFENPLNAMNKGPNAKYLDDVVEFESYPDWINKDEMNYLINEFENSGMRGPLNRYRAQRIDFEELKDFRDKKLKQPAALMVGSLDPVNFFIGDGYKDTEHLKEVFEPVYENLIKTELINDVGHWTQQEAPEEVNRFLLDFLKQI
ncbi:alpha/beta hydrolase [SAR86 cluster bacterium]|mgnify:FL=1|jgi:pimeloyl-ACP methyl ester carboxylesterase|nr:alpha/beta hydrolase [SAR86 cluster bacterium]|tara:strand:- start:725 stop:1708 length:984 start_codon:yes stop_codon:yes gene_type:complete